MPRSGWLAAGAIGAALLVPVVGWPVVGAALLAVGAGLAFRSGRGPTRGARGVVVISVGAAAILLRLLASPLPAAPDSTVPDGRGPWLFEVESVGSPRDGQQTATLRSSE